MRKLLGLLLVAALLALPALSASAKPLEVKSVEAPEEVYCDWAYPITVTLASYRDAYIKAEVKAFLDGSEVPLKLPHVEFLGPMERTYVFALQVPGEAGEHTLKVAIYFEGVEVDAKEVKFKAKPFLPTFKSPAELKGLYKAPVRIKSFSISSPVWLSQDPLGVVKVVNEGTIPVSVKLKFSGLEAYWEPSAPIKPGEVKSFEVPFKSAKPGTYTVTATLIWDEHIADTATVTVEVTGAP